MRLHTLSLEAFGPYADRQRVDFDELTEAGVFLLTGPTGAGKTSVLDAVCFALYGVVPGDREVRGLRSAHATADMPTRVVLELTLAGRRMRIERWPEWERPKRRGSGTTTERAGALLTEIGADGSERLLSSRAQEVGHELGPLLAMTSDQFMQVVLLPQGGFSTFLKADSDQRRDVLERLFATQRFTRIESWVHDRAASLRRTAEQARGDLLELLSAAAHRAGRARPDELDPEMLQAWRADVLEQARQAVRAAAAAELVSRGACEAAHEAERQAERRHSLVQRRARAESELRALSETESEALSAQRLVHDHRRAGGVAPLLEPWDEARAQLSQATTRVEQALDRLPAPLDRQGCEREVAALQRRLGELRSVEPLVTRLEEARAREDVLTGLLGEAADEVERCAVDLETLPARRDEMAALLDEARASASRRDDCERRAEAATHRRRAAAELPAAQRVAAALDVQARDAHEHSNRAHEAHLRLVERRLRGMAAELAGVLAAGSPCQVCGSTDHPEPATATPDAVTRQEQETAAAAADAAREQLDAVRQRLSQAQHQVVVLEQSAGGLDADAAAREEAATLHELRAACSAEQRAGELATGLSEVEAELGEAQRRSQAATQRHDQLVHEVAAVRRSVTDSEPQLREVLGDSPSLEAARAATHAQLTLCQEAARALACAHEAETAHTAWGRRVEQAVAEAGFDDLGQARAAVLSPEQVRHLDSLVEERAHALARAQAVLDEPEVRDLRAVGLPESEAGLEAAREEARLAAIALQEAVSAVRSAEQAAAALVGLDDQVATATQAWLPAREQHELAEAMSRLVRGMGSDNQLQMRLSSYVLATRLDQVLAAANERLQQMRDNRYTVHRSARAKAGRRSGLDIDVLDDWTGELRPPSSLSGGETFKLSLALALGLADVIKHESGGLEIETLFIDEGFGMLDPDTLDEVMDCVDDLRSCGRAVGVVSHVTELRSRVPTQLHVTPSPTGSRIHVATAAV